MLPIICKLANVPVKSLDKVIPTIWPRNLPSTALASRPYVCLFIPSGFNDTTESKRQVSFTDSLALVFLLTRSHRCLQASQIIGRRRVSHHVARPQSTNKLRTASEPRPHDKRHTIHGSQCVQITLPAGHVTRLSDERGANSKLLVKTPHTTA